MISKHEIEILTALAKATTEEEKDRLNLEWDAIIQAEIQAGYAANPDKPEHPYKPKTRNDS